MLHRDRFILSAGLCQRTAQVCGEQQQRPHTPQPMQCAPRQLCSSASISTQRPLHCLRRLHASSLLAQEGLSLDFVALNVLGFAAYSGFNLALFCSPAVQQEYAARFGGVLPVELNDVLFGLHALLLSSVTALQAAVYRKGPGQRVSILTVTAIIGVAGAAAAAVGVLLVRGEGAPPATWLDLAYAASAIKMAVSLCKYVPQVRCRTRRSSVAVQHGGGPWAA